MTHLFDPWRPCYKEEVVDVWTVRDYITKNCSSNALIMSRVDLKVVLLGSEYVGKTSLLERYAYDRFRDNFPYQNVSNSNLMT
jgi:GTPase SAR1 family protein